MGAQPTPERRRTRALLRRSSRSTFSERSSRTLERRKSRRLRRTRRTRTPPARRIWPPRSVNHGVPPPDPQRLPLRPERQSPSRRPRLGRAARGDRSAGRARSQGPHRPCRRPLRRRCQPVWRPPQLRSMRWWPSRSGTPVSLTMPRRRPLPRRPSRSRSRRTSRETRPQPLRPLRSPGPRGSTWAFPRRPSRRTCRHRPTPRPRPPSRSRGLRSGPRLRGLWLDHAPTQPRRPLRTRRRARAHRQRTTHRSTRRQRQLPTTRRQRTGHRSSSRVRRRLPRSHQKIGRPSTAARRRKTTRPTWTTPQPPVPNRPTQGPLRSWRR